jgi:phenylacetic acid degradation protein
MTIYAFEGRRPEIHASAYVAPSATVIGRVSIGARCYVGHGAIVRGDYGSVAIGDETAVEEGVIIHARPEDWTRIEERVTLGHGAMVHNATIRAGATIGMRATVSDYAEVGAGAIVGEMTLVKNSQTIPPRKVAVGVPARIVGDVGEQHRAMTHWAKDLYADLAGRYAGGALVPLPDGAPGDQLPTLVPIGVIHTPFSEPRDVPHGLKREFEGSVELNPEHAEGLADLDGFSHLALLFCFHRSSGYDLTVTPRPDKARRGLFATRAPRRPNPIGLSVVRLLAVEGTTLRVRGVDMCDGTPLLDIKPHVPLIDCPAEEVQLGWLGPRLRELERAQADQD